MAKRFSQVVVEVRIDVGIRRSTVERSQVQPLASEVLDERRRLRIGDHPAHLLLEHRRLAQRPCSARVRSSSSGMLLQRKNDSLDASARSLMR